MELIAQIEQLLDQYGTDAKQALKQNPSLSNLYALSDMRENVLEWYPFHTEGTILQVGADFGAMTGLYSRRAREVVVLDSSTHALSLTSRRYIDRTNIRYEMGDLPWLLQGEERFDHVIFVGTLTPPFDRMIADAKALTKPEGTVIAAVCNRFGVKYWAGAQRDEHSFSKSQFERLMEGGVRGSVEYYYPMPDYKLASSIYSQSYLPGKGDLTGTVTAYDYPDYIRLDSGEMFDAACEDGSFPYFANSYLAIWSHDGKN